MKIIQRPIPMTILFGFVCSISFVPLSVIMNSMFFFRSVSICMCLWLFSAGYSLLLRQWSGKKLVPILYPLSILFLAANLMTSVAAFFIFALAVISWIRSGICFQDRRWIKLFVEMLLGAAGGLFIAQFTPASAYGWALGIWMFFLLQSLYFAIFDTEAPMSQVNSGLDPDPFERSSRQVEEILSNGGIL